MVSDQLSTDDSELSELESVISHEAKEYCSPSRVDSNFSFSQSLPKGWYFTLSFECVLKL